MEGGEFLLVILDLIIGSVILGSPAFEFVGLILDDNSQSLEFLGEHDDSVLVLLEFLIASEGVGFKTGISGLPFIDFVGLLSQDLVQSFDLIGHKSNSVLQFDHLRFLSLVLLDLNLDLVESLSPIFDFSELGLDNLIESIDLGGEESNFVLVLLDSDLVDSDLLVGSLKVSDSVLVLFKLLIKELDSLLVVSDLRLEDSELIDLDLELGVLRSPAIEVSGLLVVQLIESFEFSGDHDDLVLVVLDFLLLRLDGCLLSSDENSELFDLIILGVEEFAQLLDSELGLVILSLISLAGLLELENGDVKFGELRLVLLNLLKSSVKKRVESFDLSCKESNSLLVLLSSALELSEVGDLNFELGDSLLELLRLSSGVFELVLEGLNLIEELLVSEFRFLESGLEDSVLVELSEELGVSVLVVDDLTVTEFEEVLEVLDSLLDSSELGDLRLENTDGALVLRDSLPVLLEVSLVVVEDHLESLDLGFVADAGLLKLLLLGDQLGDLFTSLVALDSPLFVILGQEVVSLLELGELLSDSSELAVLLIDLDKSSSEGFDFLFLLISEEVVSLSPVSDFSFKDGDVFQLGLEFENSNVKFLDDFLVMVSINDILDRSLVLDSPGVNLIIESFILYGE